MPTLTIRNVPDQLVKSLKALAQSRRHSMEQELRELLEAHLAERQSVLAQIEAGWSRQTRRPTVKEVVDTNVIAYFILGTEPFAEETSEFMSLLDEAWAPALWEAEFANAIWMATRHKILSVDDAVNRLTLALGLGIHAVPIHTLWQGALVRAHLSRVAVYDTLFVELAAREQLPLATYDAALLKAFPEIAFRPAALVSKC
jgi:predicted nucleic acid-binding protein/plasmid stability protein